MILYMRQKINKCLGSLVMYALLCFVSSSCGLREFCACLCFVMHYFVSILVLQLF